MLYCYVCVSCVVSYALFYASTLTQISRIRAYVVGVLSSSAAAHLSSTPIALQSMHSANTEVSKHLHQKQLRERQRLKWELLFVLVRRSLYLYSTLEHHWRLPAGVELAAVVVTTMDQARMVRLKSSVLRSGYIFLYLKILPCCYSMG